METLSDDEKTDEDEVLHESWQSWQSCRDGDCYRTGGLNGHGGTPRSLDGFCERENPI